MEVNIWVDLVLIDAVTVTASEDVDAALADVALTADVDATEMIRGFPS